MSCSDLAARPLAVLLLAAALLLGGCQPPPRPFATHALNPLLEMPESVGVVVEDVAGLPPELAEEFRDAVIDALHEAKILAGPGPGNRASFHLRGAGELAPGGAGRGYVAWELEDSNRQRLATFTSTGEFRPGTIERDNPRTLENIARRVADNLDASRVLEGQADGEAARTSVPVTVLPVEGAPGDGREALQRALGLALRNHGIRVSRNVDADGMLVYGDVTVTPMPPGRERVDIVWSVRWPDGREVGKVSQSNPIPSGLLRRTWGQIALAAADGAAEGIAALVKSVARQEADPPPQARAAPQTASEPDWNPVASARPH